MIKKFAFTLTEIMIAVGIIGIVSALTIPTMINNYQKQANVVQLRKVLNEISAAADMLITEEGKQYLIHTSLYTNGDGVDNFMNSKFKVIKQSSSDGNCFYSGAYKNLDGGSDFYDCGGGQSYLLANSAAVCPQIRGLVDEHTISMYWQIDINGSEGPNTGGRDMFLVAMNPNGEIVPAPSSYLNQSCEVSYRGQGCYQRLIDSNWKMDY